MKLRSQRSSTGNSTAYYLTIAIGAYKSGARKNEMMSLITPTLSDHDIADLSAYYASLGCAPPR